MIIILCYLFYFFAASASPLQRRWLSTKKDRVHDGQIHFAYRVTLVVAVLALLLPLFSPFYISGNLVLIAILSLACGVFGSLYFITNYTAQKHVQAGITTLVMNIYTPVTIVLASFFLNERLTSVQGVGTILLLAGMVIVSKKHKIGKVKYDRNLILMVLSGVALGFTLTAERTLLKITGLSAGTILSWWSQLIFLALIVFITKSKSKYSIKDVTITGSLRYLQSLSWVILLVAVGNLSLVSSITTFKVVLIFIAAAVFLKERDDIARKTFGSVIALAGLLLM